MAFSYQQNTSSNSICTNASHPNVINDENTNSSTENVNNTNTLLSLLCSFMACGTKNTSEISNSQLVDGIPVSV